VTRVLLVKDGLGVGGAERQLVMLASGLKDAGADVKVVNIAGRTELEVDLQCRRIEYTRLARGHRFDIRPIGQLAREIRRYQPDVVQSFHWLANLYTSLAVRHLRQPPAHAIAIRSHYYLGRKGTWRAVVDRMTARDVAIGVANCACLAQHARTHRVRYRDSAVVYNGVAIPHSLRDDHHDEVRFVTLGRLTSVKRQRDVLLAARTVASRCPIARFWFIGDGPDRPGLELLARQLDLRDRVCFAGEVADPTPILQRSSVLVLASSHEGLPNAVLEGMAAGLPVVATRVGGIPEVVEPGLTGLLVPPAQVDALAEAMLQLVANSDLRVRLGQHARCVAAERFSVDAMVSGYRRIYAGMRQHNR
jgi:glycosyltransferase involved in cell wall biosynthesis